MKTLDPRQAAAVDHICSMGRWLLLADVGTGKTVMVLTAYQRLREQGRVNKLLVIAPMRVCRLVWPAEVGEWAHLHTTVANAAGFPASKRKAILESDIEVVALNYENVQWLVETYPHGIPGRDALVWDEIDKMKDVTSKRWHAANGVDVRDKGWVRTCNYKWRGGMTGTPQPTSYVDLYGQVVTVDSRRRLVVEIEGFAGLTCPSYSFGDWRDVHFFASPWNPWQWKLHGGHAEGIEAQIAPITHRIEARVGIEKPFTIELQPRLVAFPPKIRKLYRELEREYLVYVEKNLSEGLIKVEAEHSAILYAKLRQMAQGFVYDVEKVGKKVTRTPEWLHSAKHFELSSLVSELQGTQAIIVYHFKAQLAKLKVQFPGLLALGGTAREDDEAISAWNAGKLPLLAVQPQSAGHGLNLQGSNAHHIIMLTLPESAGQVEQVIGRLARRGNQAEKVYVHHIMVATSVDVDRREHVYKKVSEQWALLKRMKEAQ